MAISFKSVAHFFAVALTAVSKELPKIEATKTVVEGVTVATGEAPLVPVEDAAYAALGAISAALTAGGAAASAKLADAGLDIVAIQKAQAVMSQVPQVVSVAKSLAPAK